MKNSKMSRKFQRGQMAVHNDKVWRITGVSKRSSTGTNRNLYYNMVQPGTKTRATVRSDKLELAG